MGMQLPALFGKYQLEKFLGGGMSQVYRATDTVLGRTVAVKILTDEGCRDEDAKKRFLLEARMCGNIVHDNIIRIHDYGELEGRPFIVMEFLTGEDLRGAIQQGHTGDLKRKLDIALQAARALGYVHKQNIVHRDIKPENLHIDESGRVRLMDFGIAKSANLSLTKTGFAIGTPYYMSPEQVLGKPVTPAVDIYAWSLVLFELLTGQKPVAGETIEVLFFQILHQPLDLTALQAIPEIPPELIHLIQRCASKKPEERPASFDVVIQELEAMLARLNSGMTQTQPFAQTMPYGVPAAPATLVAHGQTILQTGQSAQVPSGPSIIPESPATGKKNLVPILAGVAAVIVAGVIGVKVMSNQGSGTADPKGGAAAVFVLPDRYTDPMAGAEMILVKEGYFLFDKDARKEFFDAYYIDRTEVTKAQWAKYAQAKGLPAPEGDPAEPMVNITIGEAREFAAWAEKTLPTARQWEKAARGSDGRTFPWGNERTGWKANLLGAEGLPPKQVQPASAELGVSPLGVLNVAGNVWEFVDERRPPSVEFLKFLKAQGIHVAAGQEFFTMRGGSFNTPVEAATVYEFAPVLDDARSAELGFRCVKPAKIVEQELRK
jgi:serine/threonine-protein kinase